MANPTPKNAIVKAELAELEIVCASFNKSLEQLGLVVDENQANELNLYSVKVSFMLGLFRLTRNSVLAYRKEPVPAIADDVGSHNNKLLVQKVHIAYFQRQFPGSV